MHSFNKTEVERIKGVISCQVDRYRAPYGRNAEDHPRRSVFAGTTNRDDWNRDETGARRFWAVACGAINLEFLTAERDQLFAEAVHLFKHGMPWWNVPADEAAAQAELRRPEDTWEEALRDGLDDGKSYTTKEILCGALGIEVGKHDRRMEQRIAAALRVLGWRPAITKTFDRKSIRVWKKTQE
jgi:putative DNA primase/helicase